MADDALTLAIRLREYAEHRESCADHDVNADTTRCTCGLTKIDDAIEAMLVYEVENAGGSDGR